MNSKGMDKPNMAKDYKAPEETLETSQSAETPEIEKTEPTPMQEPVKEAAPEPSPEEILTAELEKTQDQYKRMLAEYDNFRRRSQKEREGIYADAALTVVGAMLPVLDNLERALAVESTDEAFKKGVELTVKQFYECLGKLNVEEIPAKGEQFDPALHNAVMHIEDDKCDDNTVVEVFQKGFRMGDRVVRHAMVKVAN